MARKKVKRGIQRGRYYWHYDSSAKKKHPSLVYKKSERRDKYHILCFTSSPGRQRIKLNSNINPKKPQKDCYVLKNPRVVYGSTLGENLKGYKVTNKADRKVLKQIKKKK